MAIADYKIIYGSRKVLTPPLASTQALLRQQSTSLMQSVATPNYSSSSSAASAAANPTSAPASPSGHRNRIYASTISLQQQHQQQQSRKRRRPCAPLSSPKQSASSLIGHRLYGVKNEEASSPVAMEIVNNINNTEAVAEQSGAGGGNGKELLVLSLAVILSLTRQAPWDELTVASPQAADAGSLAFFEPAPVHKLMPAPVSLGGFGFDLLDSGVFGGTKADRISDWLAANPLALTGQARSAYPTTIVFNQPPAGAAAANAMWNDQDAVALAFYQQSDSKDLMLGGGGGLSVLPKPPSTMSAAGRSGASSDGSRSPPGDSWWSFGGQVNGSSSSSAGDEHLSESEMQINAELDQLFPPGVLDQLDDFDPDSFLGLLNEPAGAAAAVAAVSTNDADITEAGANGIEMVDNGDAKTEECVALRAVLHNHTYAASAADAPEDEADFNSAASPAPWQRFLSDDGSVGKSAIYLAESPQLPLTNDVDLEDDFFDDDDDDDDDGSRDMRSAMYRNKDPARLLAAGVKLAYNEVVTCSHQKFLALLQCYNRRQQAVLQEVRKRGKNRLAASKCRQKKSDRVGRVREELAELNQRTARLGAQMEAAQAEERRLRDKYMQLYLTAFGRLRDAENRPLDPRMHRLQHGLDGSVILVARE